MAREPTSVWEVVPIAPERRALRKGCIAFRTATRQFRCNFTTLHLFGAKQDFQGQSWEHEQFIGRTAKGEHTATFQATSTTSKLVVMSAVLPNMMLAEQYLS